MTNDSADDKPSQDKPARRPHFVGDDEDAEAMAKYLTKQVNQPNKDIEDKKSKTS